MHCVNASMEYVTSLCSYMLTMSRSSDNLVVVGDFNFPDICWSTLCSSSPSSTRFCDGVFDCNPTQLVTAPTHIMGNILDLVLVSDADSISSLRVHPEADSPFKSDHYMVSFALRDCPRDLCHTSSTYVYDYSKATLRKIADFLPMKLDGDIHFLSGF